MAVPSNLLIAKAQATIDTIVKMSVKEKSDRPNVEFADDYNRLRKLVVESFPSLLEVMPSELDVFDTSYGYRACNVHYKEIESYCRQIVNLLGAIGE